MMLLNELQTGIGYMQQALYDKALLHFTNALSIAQENQERQFECMILTQISEIYSCKGDHQQTISFAKKGLQLAKQLDDELTSLALYCQIGYSYHWLNHYALAIEAYQTGIEISRKVGSKEREVNFQNQLGETFYYIGDIEYALQCYEGALEIAIQLKSNSEQLTALHGIARAKCDLGQFQSAQASYEAMLLLAGKSPSRNMEANALNGLGIVFSAQEKYDEAIAKYEECLAIYRSEGNLYNQASTLDNIGHTYGKMQAFAQAIVYHEKSLDISRSTNETYSEARTGRLLGYCYYKLGHLETAAQHTRRSIAWSESIRENLRRQDDYLVSIFEEHTKAYRLLQSILIAQGFTDAALETAEHGRARAFSELLADRLSEKERLEFTPEPLSVDEIRQVAIDHNATLVEYSILQDDEETLCIWLIKSTGKIHFRQIRIVPFQQFEGTLKDLIMKARRFLSSDTRDISGQPEEVEDLSQVDQALGALYEILITPIRNLLPVVETETVYFIPVGLLFLVPFAALKDPVGQYLVQSNVIAIAPSVQVLQLTQKQQKQLPKVEKKQALVVGNPVMPLVLNKSSGAFQPLNPLPAAEKEALTIARLLDTEALVGVRATKAIVLQSIGKVQIIHLATHGLFDEVQALDSAIALAPEEKEEGFLKAFDILKLNLEAEIAVLSACNTGQGRITGDGVIGLSRALIAAGVPSVLVSLWSVPDNSTAQLMVSFYQYWLKGSNKAQALRLAMLDVLNQFPKPSSWAAFILIGESESL
jgi:CHAT domain-containing protein